MLESAGNAPHTKVVSSDAHAHTRMPSSHLQAILQGNPSGHLQAALDNADAEFAAELSALQARTEELHTREEALEQRQP